MDKGWILHLVDGVAGMAEDMAEAAESGDESMLLHLLDGLKMAVSDLEKAIIGREESQE